MSRHIIHQQAIEINATDRNSAQPVFLEISRLFNNRAKDAAGYVLDKYDREDELIKLDVLEVDIGAMPFPFSEESFVKVYSEKLEEALAGAIKKHWQLAESKGQENDPSGTRRTLLQLLEQFLLTGTIAWWAGKEEMKDPVRVFETLREKEMPLLQAMILRLFPEGTVRKRLVYSFVEETIKTVVGIIQPTEKEFIVRYHARVSYLQTENRFVRTDNTGFRKALWLFILDFLADRSGSRFNRKMFVRATLNAIAQRYNMRFEELLFFFSEALKEIPENFRRTENLLSLVEEIAFEQSQQDVAAISGSSGFSAQAQQMEQIQEGQAVFFFLLNGFFPLGVPESSGAALSSGLTGLIHHHPSYVRLFFAKHGASALLRKRLVSHLTEEALKAVVRLLEPAALEMIASYVSFMTRLRKKLRFIQAEEDLFRQSVWELILAGMFSGAGSVFNTKSFLAAHIQDLAQHYEVAPVRLQAILVQEMVQQESAIDNRSGLLFLLGEILSESTATRQNDAQALQADRMMSADEQERQEQAAKENELAKQDVVRKPSKGMEVVNKQPKQERVAEKAITLPEILDGPGSAPDVLQKSFLLQAVIHLLESGKLPEWAGPAGLPADVVIKRMRAFYPNELRTAFLYVVKTGKTGLYVLHNHASLFKTELVFLFDAVFPDKLVLFFRELQARYTVPDVFFAQSLVSALAASTDTNPDLPVFFSSLLKRIEKAQGKDQAQASAFHAAAFPSLKESPKLKRAFDKAVKVYADSEASSAITYSSGNFRQALAIAFSDRRAITESELPDVLLTWIRHYASHQRLPSELKLPGLLGEKKLIAWAMEFLFRTHQQRIQELFSDAQLRVEEQVQLTELVQHTGASLQVRYFLEAQSRRRLLAQETALASLNMESPESWKWLMKQIDGQPVDSPAYKRLLKLMEQESSRILMSRAMSDQDLKYVFEKSKQPDLWTWYCHFEEVALEVIPGLFERREFRRHVIGFFLALFVRQINTQRSAKELAAHFTRFLLSKPGEIITITQERMMKRNMTRDAAISAKASELMTCLSVEMDHAFRRANTAKTIAEEITRMEKELHFRVDGHERKRLQEEQEEQRSQDRVPQKDKAPAFGEQVYIRNAGMILLHPFLATLFARAGLTKDGSFTGEEAQAKAVQLLQYAVTGTEQDPEYELVLNKLLAGLQPGEVLSHSADLQADETELITGMIHAIMMQWDKMKNTSIEGFRNAFLMREGYVFQTEESWVLRVEQRGYDVILQTLPWSFGMIKFSWMTKPLIVEWN